jgi:S-adenosylmethionine hydrolase
MGSHIIRRVAILTLTTDFGLADPYVGMMKGVVLALNPQAVLVDVTHEVPPGDVRTGAFLLAHAVRYFPSGSVHVAVVDPGVGGRRRAIAVETRSGWLVGPDNGLLSLATRGQRARTVELTARHFFRPEVSRTFHGRDVFAPVAAHLSLGVPLERLGPRVARPVALAWPRPSRRGRILVGEVVHVDRFGNLITNLEPRHVAPGARLRAGAFAAVRLCASYDSVRPGELLAIVGSYGLVELAARDGSAAAALGLGRGDRVEVAPR